MWLLRYDPLVEDTTTKKLTYAFSSFELVKAPVTTNSLTDVLLGNNSL